MYIYCTLTDAYNLLLASSAGARGSEYGRAILLLGRGWAVEVGLLCTSEQQKVVQRFGRADGAKTDDTSDDRWCFQSNTTRQSKHKYNILDAFDESDPALVYLVSPIGSSSESKSGHRSDLETWHSASRGQREPS